MNAKNKLRISVHINGLVNIRYSWNLNNVNTGMLAGKQKGWFKGVVTSLIKEGGKGGGWANMLA